MMSRCICALLLLAALGGCATPPLSSYNDSLIDLWTTRIEAEQVMDWNRLEAAVSGLSVLADETKRAADQATSDANKVALYRVAGTAAWQSGREDTTSLISDGVDLCRADTARTLPPRDCGMLLTIPIFVAVDINVERFDDLNAAVGSTPAAQRPQMHGPAAREIFRDFVDAARLFLSRPTSQTLNASPGFFEELERNGEAIFRNVESAQQLVVRVFPPGEERRATACQVEDLREDASAASIRHAILDMLTTSECTR